MPNSKDLCFIKLSVNAQAPTKANSLDAGFDLYCAHNYTIDPLGMQIIHTDIAIQVPIGKIS